MNIDPLVMFCAHTLCMNFVIATFLLVNCLNTRNHLLYFVRFCARSTPKSEQKHFTKTFAGLHNHSPLLLCRNVNRHFCLKIENFLAPLCNVM